MSLVTSQMSISLDGCYAGRRHPGDPKDMAGWMASPEAFGFFRVTRWVIDAMAWRERQGFEGGERDVNSEIVEETFESAGAYVMGRHMFEEGEVGWPEEAPFHAPVFVLTHTPREPWPRKGGTTFTFVTDGMKSGLEQAKAAARGKDVRISGGAATIRQFLKAGLVDEFTLHFSPVIQGAGVSLFDHMAHDDFKMEQAQVIASRLTTHITYRVAR